MNSPADSSEGSAEAEGSAEETRVRRRAGDGMQPSSSAADIDWDQLGECVERFLEAWEADGFGSLISEFVPPGHPVQRRAVLIELTKIDLEYRLRGDGPVLQLEDYVAENPEIGQPDGMPVELIIEEYHLRGAAGEDVSIADYISRFPERRTEIQAQFPGEETSGMAPTGSSLADEFRPGDRVSDFYLMSALGTGAFGSVFLARQESMQRMVALKISGDKGTEGQTLAQLDHSNIVRVYDQVRLPEQNLRLLYMQFAPGGTLQTVIKESKWVKTKTGRVVAECIADAVQRTGVLSSQSIPLKGGLSDRP